MKCPKCNFASFEYLNTCKKCGNDLSLHKTELGIDYPQYSTLGLMATLRHEASPQAAMAETATMVEDHLSADQFSETSATDKMSGTSGFEAAIGSDTDFTNIGKGVDLGEHDELDLSGLGESADETASITLPSIEEEELNIGAEPAAATTVEPPKEAVKADAPGGLDGIDFDLGSLDEAPAPPEKAATLDIGEIEEAVIPPAKEEEFSIDMGDLDLGLAESAEPAAPAAAPAAPDPLADIDLGDIDISIDEEKPAAPKAASPAAPASDLNMDGFDLDINFDDIDLSGADKPSAGGKEEPKKDEKKKDDFDIDIDLSDLKLD